MPVTIFSLASPQFQDGETIPSLYTCEGDNIAPALEWSGAPAGTKSYALIMHDPDTPRGDLTHWVLYNIPASASGLPEGGEAGAIGTDGTNIRGDAGYRGPCPPPGHGPHRYFFEFYAVDAETVDAQDGAGREELETALQNHTLAHTTLTGMYERKADE